MILCPNCLHKELVGAFFCSECGAQLVYSNGVPTSTIRTTSGGLSAETLTQQVQEETIGVAEPPPAADLPNAVISLNIINSNEIIPLADQECIMRIAAPNRTWVSMNWMEAYASAALGL